ncbi:MAG: helix-turn-helix domain-containing protein [Thermaerobacter sp.]|nr:helix-turn-helix domain-containing protein [Thermaerobacter sp.]
MPTTETFEHLVAARPDEAPRIRELSRKLADDHKEAHYFLSDSDGKGLEIPPSVFRILVRAVRDLSLGRSVAIIHYDQQLTTQQAADILNVSRPHLIKLVEDGKLPYHMVGTHRRIRMGDLLAFKEARDSERRSALRELRKVSESLGLYNGEK